MALNNSFGPDGFGVGEVRASAFDGSGTGTYRLMRSKTLSHGGTSFTRSIHVEHDFGFSKTGGYLQFMMSGWVNEYYLGIMRWHNAGSSGGIVSAEVINVNSRGFTVTGTHDSDKTVTFNVTGAHGNGHGFQFFVWCGT